MSELPNQTEASTRSLNPLLILFGIGLLAGVLMAGLTILGNPANRSGAVTIGNAPLPTPVPDSIREGEIAPNFVSVAPDGTQIELSDYRGTPVAINFWATWCVPCVIEMPALQSAAENYAGGDLVVLGVNAGESPERVSEFLLENGLTFPHHHG